MNDIRIMISLAIMDMGSKVKFLKKKEQVREKEHTHGGTKIKHKSSGVYVPMGRTDVTKMSRLKKCYKLHLHCFIFCVGTHCQRQFNGDLTKVISKKKKSFQNFV